MQIALHDNDLTESQDLVRQLEYNKTGLQGQIRAKNQEIVRRQLESWEKDTSITVETHAKTL